MDNSDELQPSQRKSKTRLPTHLYLLLQQPNHTWQALRFRIDPKPELLGIKQRFFDFRRRQNAELPGRAKEAVGS
jgi:hypothetical protein